ncbi:MAG: adenylate kinase family protein [Aggregatilineales bacterium]
MADYVILMGMQGAGKGTQAEALSKDRHLPHVTSGGMFRTIKTQDSPLARQVASFLDAGKLVPDALTVEMIKGRLREPDAANGVILDGFPRTLPQAEALDGLMTELGEWILLVPYFVISEGEALARLSGRLVCTANDNHVYNVRDNPPRKPGVCDIDGKPLKVRDDDQPEAIKARIAAYKADTEPLLDYYRARGVLREINAEQPIDRVTADLKAAVEAAKSR